ncbi:mitochondrial glycoprotein [Epithele typhae]|uniref:mitochondrial glycoprotein n=1 Tax=Epithele typhae TaxID=378194 RepID=UPI00200725F2|nr:mitochondrial glycoprotein [Epithele typhae]KAH9916979.1 mitochondrial glycoprotein [Epithele typhae]
MSAFRAIRQVSSLSARTLATRAAPRTLARAALEAGRLAPVAASASRAFSVSARRLGEGSTDVALTQRLAEELKYEKEGIAGEPDFLKAFKEQGIWKIEDTPGMDEVILTRKFGNEDIRLVFSVSDVQSAEQDFEEGESPAEESEESESSMESSPMRVSFLFTKSNTPGSVSFDGMCQDGAFTIDNVTYYTDAKMATDLTAEADWKRRGYYIGPTFETLDATLQEEFDHFLEERGINSALAYFIPEYAEHKEQKEYVSWLTSIKSFVEA